MLLVKNIAKIVGVDESGRLRVKGRDMNVLGEIDNAWLLADGDRIAAYGTMDKMPEITPDTEVVDAEGGMLFPSFCDSHTHLVYAGSREQEFLDKINGLSYEEIAKRGGGILNSADRLHETSEDELYEQAMERIREIIAMGTGCVEIKSGYGLTTEDELKMLRVIRRIRETSPITVRATFLGAHAVGRAYKGRQQEYVDLICREMIPAVGREKLAEFVDVFCDQGFFTVEETEQILRAGAEYGLVPKIHANELAVSGGVQVGVRNKALSVDHLERMGAEEIEVLRTSGTMPTMLQENLSLETSFKSYLYTIAHNLIIDSFRKKIDSVAFEVYIQSDAYQNYTENNTENEVYFDEFLDKLNEAKKKLSSRQLVIFELSREKGCSIKDIAEKMGISEKTVKNQLTLALKTLKSELSLLHYLLLVLLLLRNEF